MAFVAVRPDSFIRAITLAFGDSSKVPARRKLVVRTIAAICAASVVVEFAYEFRFE